MTLEAIPYSDVAGQLVRVIRAMDGWLAKAEEHARAKNYDINVHLVSRLAPDMEAFAFQIQTATDYARSIAGWFTGERLPPAAHDEATVAGLRARLAAAAALVEERLTADYVGAGGKEVKSRFLGPGQTIGMNGFLLQIALPNFYFHATVAYTILRHAGVDLGKRDFLGTLAPTVQ